MKALLSISPLPAPVFAGVMLSWLPISITLLIGVLTTIATFAVLWTVFRNDEDQLTRY